MPRHGYESQTPDWNGLKSSWLRPLKISDVHELTWLATVVKNAGNAADHDNGGSLTKSGVDQGEHLGYGRGHTPLVVVNSETQRGAQYMRIPQSVRDEPCVSPQRITAASRVLPFPIVTMSPEERLQALRDVDPETASVIDAIIEQMHGRRCAAQR